MKILVTGGSGKVGKYVAKRLAAGGHDVTNLDRVAPPSGFNDVHWLEADILDPAAMHDAIRGYDAVAHLAGIPIPLFHPAEEVFRVNVMGTFNVVNAAGDNGIPRLVYMSSESTLGFAFMTNHQDPLYAPIDEDHPLRPQDAYGMSKIAAEEVCQAVARRSGMAITILRPPWIWVPEPGEREMYRQLVSEPNNWYKQLWSFCGVEDVAAAVELALVGDTSEEEDEPPTPDPFRPAAAYFICADDNWTGRPTLELLDMHYNVLPGAINLDGAQSALSNRAARRDLGWAPQQKAEDFL